MEQRCRFIGSTYCKFPCDVFEVKTRAKVLVTVVSHMQRAYDVPSSGKCCTYLQFFTMDVANFCPLRAMLLIMAERNKSKASRSAFIPRLFKTMVLKCALDSPCRHHLLLASAKVAR